jgi:hypothetical protein
MNKSFVFAIAMIGLSASAFAQATASATGTATIIEPISIANAQDMNFGNIAINASAGTVELAPDAQRTPGGGATLPVVAGTVTAAEFDVAGEGTSTYDITLPSADYTITRVSGSETMTINLFTSSVGAAGELVGGLETFQVGATLNIGGSQVPGVYTNATGFDVTVNYN